MSKQPSEGMSPYVKYKKTPYRYSDELNNWTAAIKKGDKAAADRYDRAWKNKFGIKDAPPANYNSFVDVEIEEAYNEVHR